MLFAVPASAVTVKTQVIGQIATSGGAGGSGASTSDMIFSTGAGWAGGAGGVQGYLSLNNSGTNSGTLASNETLNFPIGSTIASLNSTYGAGNWTVTGARLTFQSSYSIQNNNRFGTGAGNYYVYYVAKNSWYETTSVGGTNPIYATDQTTLNTWAGSSSLLAMQSFGCALCSYSPKPLSNAPYGYTTVTIPLTDTAALNTAIAASATATIPDISLYLMQKSDTLGMIIFTGGQSQILAYLTLDVSVNVPSTLATSGDVEPTSTDPSAWTNATAALIGNTSAGTLAVTGGQTVTSGAAQLGVASGVTGQLYVDGAGSSFTNSSVQVGYNGTGLLSVTNGGTVVSNGTATSVSAIGGYASGSLVVSGAGSTFTSTPLLNVAAYLNTSNLYTAQGSNGSITVTNGGVINDATGINIGAAAYSSIVEAGSNGTVNVDGKGSAINSGSGTISVGASGLGTMAVTNGAAVNAVNVNVGLNRETTSQVNVDGSGSALAASTALNMGSSAVAWDMTGSLAVTDGAEVTAQSLNMYSSGKETLTVDTASSVTVSGAVTTANATTSTGSASPYDTVSSSLITTNAVTINQVSGIGAAAGTYTPLAYGSLSNSVGTIEALGGVLNASNQIVVGSTYTANSGSATVIDLSQVQRIAVSDSISGQVAGVGLLGTTTSGTSVTLTATAASSADIALLADALASGKNIDSAWTVSFNNASGTSTYSSPFYLSLYAGAGKSATGLSVYMNTGYGWVQASGVKDLAYDGTYASFTADVAAEYAIVETPATAPTISLAAGTYSSAQSVTIDGGLSGATVYYTTDGTTPTTSSTLYSGAISVGTSETITAIAVAPGYTPSAASSAAYTINLTPTAAVMSSPVDGSTLTGASTTFTWTAGTNVSGYYLWVGTTAGAYDLVNVGPLTGTSYTATLPTNGSTVYVTLYSVVNGTPSLSNTYSYTEYSVSPAVMSSPANGSTLTGASTTFTWSAGTNVSGYYLWVGTTPGGYDLVNVGPLTGTSYTTTLPTNGSTVYVTLYSVVNGTPSLSNTYSYTEYSSTAAAITSPTSGSTLTGTSTTFTWSAGTNVSGYYLWLGTTAGGHDLVNVGPLTGTSYTTTLPTTGGTVYATLYSVVNGTPSLSNTYSYTEYSVSPAAITSPTNGSSLTGASTTFTWSAGTNVSGYYLWVGTTAGAYDLVNVGPLTGTSYTAILPTNGSTVYVTLYSVVNGTPSLSNTYSYTEAAAN
ncbi:MAG: chitobiase/beta-hexosaminidase C-terminal domain-containing protein [Acidobacteriota bacterium]|nr:chitobiase/beta-hexosaminidase C-terminal domain-containing protein [Acidobacteriota bacterium]